MKMVLLLRMFLPANGLLLSLLSLQRNDSLQTFRQSFTVGADSSQRTNLSFTSLEVVTINFQLQEMDTDTNMSDVRITLVSHDGFGNITLSKSDANGNVGENIMPGNWSMYLNKSDPQLRWVEYIVNPILNC